MSYSAEIKRRARRNYVFDRFAIPTISKTLNVPEVTLRRWKAAAKADGDDWDRARAANMVSGEGFESAALDLIERFVIQFQATINSLEADDTIPPADRAKIMTSLGDSFNKTMASAGRIAPKISELSVASDVLRRMADFVKTHYPQHGDAFLEVLEPFGSHIAEVYG